MHKIKLSGEIPTVIFLWKISLKIKSNSFVFGWGFCVFAQSSRFYERTVKMDNKGKKKNIQVEVPYRNIPEVQTKCGVTFEEKQYAKAHPESIYGGPTKTDVLGSYTGQPTDRYEKPVQDADDL